ncbi:MAG: hypothetical protein J5I94_23320 [Phaeodactylibacter sp.]|nr:hypothetical protein [Phaeodactylibacter sp.]
MKFMTICFEVFKDVPYSFKTKGRTLNLHFIVAGGEESLAEREGRGKERWATVYCNKETAFFEKIDDCRVTTFLLPK